ncbi:ferredoxin family protein [Chloroflexota bacterium]
MISIDIDNDLCVGCKLCAHICPEMVLAMAGGYVATVIRLEKCNLCMACEQQCPEDCLKVSEK